MLKKDLHLGLQVAVRDPWKKVERGEITDLHRDEGRERWQVRLETGRSKGKQIEVTSRAIVSTWEEYGPIYEVHRRQELRAEAARIIGEKEQGEKTEQLQVIREHLRLHGIQSALGNVHVPGSGYEIALLIRYDGCLTLDKILTDVASANLLGHQTNDS